MKHSGPRRLRPLLLTAALAPAAALLFAHAAFSAPVPGEKPGPIFEADVFPILSQRCAECHGISKQSGGLRLDSFEGLVKGGKKGKVIVPGKSGESLLFERITAEGKRRMPPKGDPVPPPEIVLIKSWIDGGARSSPGAAPAEPEIQVGKLPRGYAPVLAVAGNREGTRLAVGRGEAIVISGIAPEAAPAAGAAAAGAPPAGSPPASLDAEKTLDGGGDLVQCLAWSPDGKLLVSGGFREVLLWDTRSWTLKRRLGPHTDRVLALAFSRDGSLLAAGGGLPSQSGEVKVWEAATGKLMRTLPDVHTDTVFSIDFSPDGARIATGSGDRMVHLIDLASGKRTARFEGHTHHVLSVAFSPDGKRLLSAGADAKVKSWNVEKGELERDWGGHGKAVTAVAYSPDGKFAASASGDRTVRFWNPENGGQTRALGEARDYLYAVSIFGGGKLVAAAGRDRVVRIYDAKDGKLLRSIEPPPVQKPF
jgi:hypothetical protein